MVGDDGLREMFRSNKEQREYKEIYGRDDSDSCATR
jgi:hypothetical protein